MFKQKIKLKLDCIQALYMKKANLKIQTLLIRTFMNQFYDRFCIKCIHIVEMIINLIEIYLNVSIWT